MVEITEHNAREAGAAAQRLLTDRYLAEALNEMVSMETEKAIMGPTPEAREQARQQVLAVNQLRVNLQAVAENWQSLAQTLNAEKQWE